MATRFYLPHLGSAPAVTPAFSAGWDATGTAVREKLVTAKTNTTLTNILTAGPGASGKNVLVKQYVSSALAAQTISGGTLLGQIKANESASANNYGVQVRAYIYRPGTSAIVGDLISLDAYTPGAATPPEFSTTSTNRRMPQTNATGNVSSVTAQANDVLVVEIGYKTGSTSTGNGNLKFGDNQASDMPVDETTTTDGNPWVESSQVISFNTATQELTLATMGVGA